MAISIVQQAGNTLSAAGTTITATLGAGSTAGNCLLAVLGATSAGGIFTAPSGWNVAVFNPDPTNFRPVSILYYPNCPGGLTSFPFQLSVSGGFNARVLEVAGLATTVDPLDQKTLIYGGSGTAITVGPTPPTQMGAEFCIASFVTANVTTSLPTNGYAIQGTDTSAGTNLTLCTSTLIQAAIANQFTGITISALHTYSAIIATFFAAPGPTSQRAIYYIKARVNSSLLVADAAIEHDYESLKIQKVFNGVGTWALQLRKESAHYATFAPVWTSGVPGFPNGIIVQVDNQDGNGLQLVMSGPQTDIDVKSQMDMTQPALITGVSDEYALAKRRALQVPHYPYPYYCTAVGIPAPIESGWYNLLSSSPKRFYTCGEASGTVATDTMGLGNGTYTNTVTLAQPGLIDDPHTSVLFSATGYISVPTAGLNGANLAWSVTGWGMLTSNPAGTIYMWGFGTNAAKEEINLGVTAGGLPTITGNGLVAITGATAVPLNTPFFLAATYDSTTLTGYVGASGTFASFGSNAPGVLAITYGAATFSGQHSLAGNMWTPGYLSMGGFYNGTLTAAMLATMYTIGQSRQEYLAYDSLQSLNVSTAMIYGVQRNAAAAATLANYGVAAPAAAFTNWQLSHGARQVPGLTLAADPVLGSLITYIARQDNLLDLIAALALSGSTELGFKLEQVGSNLVFTVYAPTDLTASVIFSRDLYGATGNILDYEWKASAATANHIIAGGANPVAGSTNLIDRLFGEGENANSVTANGYLEDFLDFRQAATGPTLQQAVTAQLAKSASIFQFQATMIDQPGVLYWKGPSGKGYDLGNKVTVIVDGQTLQQVIRAVVIDLEPGAAPIITPVVGTPGTSVINEYDVIAAHLIALGISTANLNTNY